MTDSFGQRLRRFRLKAGLSQQKLADNINVSLKTVQRWEKNERQPRIEEVKNLALALHVSEQDLIHDSGTQSSDWVVSVRIAQNLHEEVIDLSKGVPRIATITTSKDGGLLTLGGSYENWTDDNAFKKLIADLKKFRNTVIQNGIALGGIKE
ncbi:MAG: helix-turn-helix domain-containing protein [Synergistaceae bacterium]|nr:helix-turn-helix domain-containing protein [Synergistaceae bacterium]